MLVSTITLGILVWAYGMYVLLVENDMGAGLYLFAGFLINLASGFWLSKKRRLAFYQFFFRGHSDEERN